MSDGAPDPDSEMVLLLTLSDARRLSGCGATYLRARLDSGDIKGAWVQGRAGRERRWNARSLDAWISDHPRSIRRPRADLEPGQGPDPLAEEISRLKAELVSVKDAALLQGLALVALEEAWELADRADSLRREAQQKFRQTISLQREALAQFQLPGHPPDAGVN